MNNLLYKIAERYFCVWDNRSDLEWVVRIWGKLRWFGGDELRDQKIKIYLLTLANIFYEFIHEAYSDSYELLIEDDIEFLIEECKIKPINIIELLVERKIEIRYDYNFIWGVYELIRIYKNEVFNDLKKAYKDVDELCSALINLKPELEISGRGRTYIRSWGTSYDSIK